MENYTNELIRETSPYLLQHAHNPVNWIPWSEDVFELAKKENKLVLISVGYSSCHWCHVMEHESFEDEEVAALMNKFFINVKVDREERPDVDQVYMTAVQLMTNKGGWPLNCFTLPDGRPIYGGTYFPKEQWMHLLKSLNHAYTNELDKVLEYAEQVHRGVIDHSLIKSSSEVNKFEEDHLKELVTRWSKSFDRTNGGETRAPKFPLPSNYEFLLDYAICSDDSRTLQHVEHTLNKMAMGGIYDQIGGGFSRYSVDMLWKIPHFEKMLYDNGQLLGLYAKAYKVFRKPIYKKVVYQTVEWLEREMHHESGAFYSALDADSEGVEGKYYVWKKEELEVLLENDFNWVQEFYNINQRGFWEDDNYVLIRNEDEVSFANRHNWSLAEFDEKLDRVQDLLLSARRERVAPGLDDKCLTSWNALTIKGLCLAYEAFQDEIFLYLALKAAKWLEENQLSDDGKLMRSFKNGQSTIDGFLEDYANVMDAFLHVYYITGDEQWLEHLEKMENYTYEHFYDANSGMYFFTEDTTDLIARKMELNDNVIPSSNSVMARNLYYLGTLWHRNDLIQRGRQMLGNVYDGMELFGSGYSNWGMLLLHEVYGLYEFVCVGENASHLAQELRSAKLPEAIIVSKSAHDELAIFDYKDDSESFIYVCTQGTCLAPVKTVTEAIETVIQ